MNKEELIQKVNQLGPWHYCHILPHGVSTGSCHVETVHDKLFQLLSKNMFLRPMYSKVLDLGANSGIISMWFADNKNSTVDAYERGVKYYPQLEFAVEVKGYSNKIIPFNQDITECKFRKTHYDLVLYLGTMHHVHQDFHLSVLEKCLEALAPGGEIVVQTKDTLPVPQLLAESGFLGVDCAGLKQYWGDREAWFAYKDPMKV